MSLDEAKDGDEIIKDDDFQFIIGDGLSEDYSIFTVDYSNSWLKKGFSVIPDRSGPSCH